MTVSLWVSPAGALPLPVLFPVATWPPALSGMGTRAGQADGVLCALWSQEADSGPDSATRTVRVPCDLWLVPSSLSLLHVPNPRILHTQCSCQD